MELKCTSCQMNVLAKGNFVRFHCPDCDKVEIIRCESCKIHPNKYVCQGCGFTGP